MESFFEQDLHSVIASFAAIDEVEVEDGNNVGLRPARDCCEAGQKS